MDIILKLNKLTQAVILTLIFFIMIFIIALSVCVVGFVIIQLAEYSYTLTNYLVADEYRNLLGNVIMSLGFFFLIMLLLVLTATKIEVNEVLYPRKRKTTSF